MADEKTEGVLLHITPEECDSMVTAEGVTLSDGTRVPSGTPLTELFPDGIWARVGKEKVEILSDERRY